MLTDIYVLAPERSAGLMQRFLDHFLPDREETAEDYPVPGFSDHPDITFRTAEVATEYCCLHPDAAQNIYRLNTNENCDPQSAHVFFLRDGGLVLGLSAPVDISEVVPGIWHQLLEELKQFAGSRVGYCVLETPPADTTEDFKRAAEQYEKQV